MATMFYIYRCVIVVGTLQNWFWQIQRIASICTSQIRQVKPRIRLTPRTQRVYWPKFLEQVSAIISKPIFLIKTFYFTIKTFLTKLIFQFFQLCLKTNLYKRRTLDAYQFRTKQGLTTSEKQGCGKKWFWKKLLSSFFSFKSTSDIKSKYCLISKALFK